MEIIEMTGYTIEEKLQIAKRYLVPKQRKDHGLKATDIKIDDASLLKIIEGYTRESGVRNLEQKVGTVIRKIAKSIAMDQEYSKTVKAEQIEKYLGAEIFDKDLYQDNDFAGVVTGLAWTSVGGEILFHRNKLKPWKRRINIIGAAW